MSNSNTTFAQLADDLRFASILSPTMDYIEMNDFLNGSGSATVELTSYLNEEFEAGENEFDLDILAIVADLKSIAHDGFDIA